jgi:integrating conjugative element protein (TIGR03749 family)
MKKLLLIPILCTFAPLANAVEILRWERLPLTVPLVVHEERVIFIDRNVRLGLPPSLNGRLRAQSAGGAVYLRASAPIEPTRIQLRDAKSGALILLDITAKPAEDGASPLEPVRIVLDNAEKTAPRESAPSRADAPSAETPIPVTLVRHAAQSLYAPLRTIEPVPGIAPVRLRADLPLDTLMPGLPVRVTPLSAWRLEDFWVTAAKLTNTTDRWLDLDPRALQGDLAAAAFQHSSLGPSGTAEDTTTVYLVTRGHALAEALLPTILPADAAANLPKGHDRGHNKGRHHEK